MFEGEDRQSIIDNETITEEHLKALRQVLDAIATTIKSEDYFWHFQDELLSDVCQWSSEAICALNTCIIALVNQYQFPDVNIKQTLKIIILQHVVRYLEAQNWIHLQHKSQLTYQALLSKCQLLEL